MNALCKGFDYRARYAAPETHGAPIGYGAGTVTFPPLAFWRCRYGFRGKYSPQWAEYLSLDFQPLGGFATGVVMRILDYLYESPLGGSADEREAVLTELSQFLDVATHFRLRANADLADGRSWRCHFFQRVTITDQGFWQRLALVYARLAPNSATNDATEPARLWCHALVEEASFWQAPICTPQWREALCTAPGVATLPAAPMPSPDNVEQPTTNELRPEPVPASPAASGSALQPQPDSIPQEGKAAPTVAENSTMAGRRSLVSTSLAIGGVPMGLDARGDSQRPDPDPHSLHPIQRTSSRPLTLHKRGPCHARASPTADSINNTARSIIHPGRDPPKI